MLCCKSVLLEASGLEGSSMFIKVGSEDEDVAEALEPEREDEAEEGVSFKKNVMNCKRHSSNSRLLPLLSSSALWIRAQRIAGPSWWFCRSS